MRDDRRYRDGPQQCDSDAANKSAAAAAFAEHDRLTARGILLRVGHRALPVLPRTPLVTVLVAAGLALPSTSKSQNGVRATATASVRILPSSVRLSGGAVVVERARVVDAGTVIVMTSPPVVRACDVLATGMVCRMLVVDLP